MLTTKDDLVDKYKKFLANEHRGHIKLFCARLASDPAAARAEVITFYFLRDNVDEVQVEEHLADGGVDFRCRKGKSEFVVEVTHLEDDSVSKASGRRNEIPENNPGSSGRITRKLKRTASKEADQMSGYCCPRLLVMMSEHVYADDLLSSALAAESLLTGDTSIPVHPSPNLEPDLVLETDLKNSAFFRVNTQNNEVESCRRSISAILLCSIYPNAMGVVGLLHPDPVHKFPIKFLPPVPFVKLKRWPIENNRIQTEWVTHEQTNSVIPVRLPEFHEAHRVTHEQTNSVPTQAFWWDYCNTDVPIGEILRSHSIVGI